MAAAPSTVVGIRMAESRWAELKEEAAALGMTRNEYVARRLGAAVSPAAKVRKSDKSIESADDLGSAFREDS